MSNFVSSSYKLLIRNYNTWENYNTKCEINRNRIYRNIYFIILLCNLIILTRSINYYTACIGYLVIIKNMGFYFFLFNSSFYVNGKRIDFFEKVYCVINLQRDQIYSYFENIIIFDLFQESKIKINTKLGLCASCTWKK